MKKVLSKLANIFAGIALFVAVTSANTSCVFIAHQPREPERVKALRKF